MEEIFFYTKGISEKIRDKIQEKVKTNEEFYVQYMDVGAYSTRPGALDISAEEEWSRLSYFFEIFKDTNHFMKISVDTFRSEIAKKALGQGVNMINDVSGLSDSKMLDVLKDSTCDYVLMHSLCVPTDKKITFSEEQDPVEELKNWLEQKLNVFEKNRIHLKRIIFDPGIGFGKTAEQSLILLKNITAFTKYPVRLMVGHSRKSFMTSFSKVQNPSLRDFESIGISMELAEKGVDIIRVHEASKHVRSWLAYKHIS